MTDEIRITRRVALPDKYEFFEMTITHKIRSDEVEEGIEALLDMMEKRVEYIRENYGKPTPEISPKIHPGKLR